MSELIILIWWVGTLYTWGKRVQDADTVGIKASMLVLCLLLWPVLLGIHDSNK